MQNPYMETLAQGGSVANQGMSQASNSLSHVADIFNSSASLAMKMNVLLEQEEARKQQELMQTEQFMHKVQQDNFMNQYRANQLNQQNEQFNKKFDLENKQYEQNKNYQDNILDLKREELKLKSKPKQLGVEDQLIQTGYSQFNQNGYKFDPTSGSVIDSNGHIVKDLTPAEQAFVKKYGYKPTAGGTLGTLKMEPTVAKNLTGELSSVYMSDKNTYDKYSLMNTIAGKYGMNLSELAKWSKKNNPELYSYITSTMSDVYKQSLIDGNKKVTDSVGSQLDTINPRLTKQLQNDAKTDFTITSQLVPIIVKNSHSSDNENFLGGSARFFYKFNDEEAESTLRNDPRLALAVGLTNDVSDRANIISWSRWFDTNKKSSLSNMFDKDWGLDPINFDVLQKDGVISKETVEQMRDLAKTYNNVFADSMLGSTYNDSPIQNNKDILTAQPSLDTRTTTPYLDTTQQFGNIKLGKDVKDYYSSKQRIIDLFKRDKLDEAYKKVTDYTKEKYEHYVTFGGMDPETAYKTAKDDTFKHFDKKTLGKAILFTYFLVKAKQNTLNK